MWLRPAQYKLAGSMRYTVHRPRVGDLIEDLIRKKSPEDFRLSPLRS